MYPKFHTTLYHGTISEISAIDTGAGRDRKDFGKGFYISVSKSQAIGMMHKKHREAIRRNRNKADTTIKEYLYEIALDEEVLKGLAIKVFPTADLEWLDFVLLCRSQGGMPHAYDLVVGPTADDDTALCLKLYEEGAYGEKGSEQAKKILLNNLEVENLGIQYFVGKQAVADALIKRIQQIEWR